MCLDLESPVKVIGSKIADANGNAELKRTIPVNTPLIAIWTQAAIIRGIDGADSVKSNDVEATVQ
jgi:hypothetical protein